MLLQSAKFLGAGLATIGLAGAGVGIGNVFGWSLANNWGIVFCGISRRLLTDNERDYIYNSGVWNMRGESKIVEILPVYLADIQAMLVASL